jgi:Tfp pilus assembly protein PilO
MSLPARIAALLVALIAAVGLGYKVGMDVRQGQWDAAKVAESETRSQALQAAAEAIAKIEVKHQTIVQKVRHEITKETAYRDCIVPDDGRRLLNAAASGASEPAGGE